MKKLFIIGMYKSGTTWLLSALAHHPEVQAYREFDLVRAFFDVHGERASALEPGRRFDNVFSRYPFCRLGDLELAEVKRGNTQILQEIALKRRTPKREPRRTLLDLPIDSLVHIREVLLAGGEEMSAPRSLLDLLSLPSGAEHAQALVLKSADQVPVTWKLDQIVPGAKKIAIVRDGRDATVSAYYFRKLMAERNPPWAINRAELTVQQLFRGWVNRARMVKEMAGNPNVYVLRYEDLHEDFLHHFASLLDWCQLTASPDLLQDIFSRTTFRAQAGRDAGEEKAEVLRKGVVGDWQEKLSKDLAASLWEEGEDLFRFFGYREDGSRQQHTR